MSLRKATNFYLVGIKGVGMTALAEVLLDAGKKVRGSDVAADFVTVEQLAARGIEIDIGFEANLPEETEVVIFSGANGGSQNPQVIAARQRGLPSYTHMEAVAQFFNEKQGIAVCGVGGKSSVSAMVTWILEKMGEKISYAVGVGEIKGLPRTGRWQEQGDYFVVEADEYIDDPASAATSAATAEKPAIFRFLYLKPLTTVCTNLRFDHPDVYRDFAHTKEVFGQFFAQTKPGGSLIVNGDDTELSSLAKQVAGEKNLKLLCFGEGEHCDLRLTDYKSEPGRTLAKITYQNQTYNITLRLPGKFNVYNALAALSVVSNLGLDVATACQVLAEYQSVKRRFEFLGEKNAVRFYDDYAHHPSEVAAAIAALAQWFPRQRRIIIFQSHTFSRTKNLFEEFVASFQGAEEILMTEIFPSAREARDESVSSTLLCEAINQQAGHQLAQNLHSNEQVATWIKENLRAGDVVLTLGAGDIYEIFDLL